MLKWTQQYKEAERIWRTALPIVSECNFPRLGSELCQALSTLASYTGSFEEAYRLQLDSQSYGNRVGVISPILQNQQMLLRSAMHETGQLENKLNYLTEGVEASEDGIFVLGAPSTGLAKTGFVIHFANNAAAQFLGKRPIEIMHVQIDSVWKSSSSQRLIEESLHVYSTGDRRSLEPIELEFTPGDHRLFSVKIAKTKQGVAWTVIDISEKEAMRQQIVAQRDSLEDANQKLIALNTEKNAMLGIAAHDLRSPIANVRSLCELIKAHDDESQKALSLIEATSESLLDLISNLLDVERIESGQYPFAHHSQKIAALIGPIVQQFEASAREKDISISVDFGTQDVEISVDEVSFCRIIQNLLSNALKFSPKGSKVGVRSYQHDNFVRIEIQDQGPGLTDEDKGLLFGKFARLSARPTAGEPSNGLGLPIVKHLVEAMGGTVGCESQFGHGATFWVQFPAQR
jgi:signal transduction histidine kinase